MGAALVRRIFTTVAAGTSLHDLARQLNQDGVPTPRKGAYWRVGTLRKIVYNDLYLGQARYGSASNDAPAIIIQMIRDYHSMGALLPQRAHPALARTDGKVMILHMTTAARFFDMSPSGADIPPGWMPPGFDDSAWDHATVVKSKYSCGGIPVGNGSYYWGPQASDEYLFRQTFLVPRARSYYGSELTITTTAQLSSDGGKLPYLAINGRSLHPGNTQRDRISIVHYLHPGINVLTAYLKTYSGVSWCSAFEDSMTLRLTGLQRPYPLVLSWQPVKNAARYDVQVWLVTAAPGQTITPNSEVNIATQTRGPSATLDDATMPSGTYQWRTAAVNAHGTPISRWTPAQMAALN